MRRGEKLCVYGFNSRRNEQNIKMFVYTMGRLYNLQEKCIYFISVLEKCWKRIKLIFIAVKKEIVKFFVSFPFSNVKNCDLIYCLLCDAVWFLLSFSLFFHIFQVILHSVKVVIAKLYQCLSKLKNRWDISDESAFCVILIVSFFWCSFFLQNFNKNQKISISLPIRSKKPKKMEIE